MTAQQAEPQLWSEDELKDFPKPPLDAPLWRYFRPEHFEDLLSTEQLYFRQVAAFDDTAEGLMNDYQIKSMEAQCKDNPGLLPSARAMHEAIRRSSWVCCFTTHHDEQRHMFKRFCGPSGCGAAVLTSFRRIEEARLSHPNQCPVAVEASLVRYTASEYMPWKVGYLLFQKLPHYRDEAEFRLCICVPGYNFHVPKSRPFVRVWVVLPFLIERIVVHPEANRSYFDRVCHLAAKHLPRGRRLVSWSRLPMCGGRDW